MTSTAKCPQCGTLMGVPEDLRGEEVECPNCGRAFSSVPPEPEEPEFDDPPRRKRSRRRYYDDEPRNRRQDAEALLKPCAIALLVVTILRTFLNGACAVGGGFILVNGGLNPGTMVIIAVTALSFSMNALAIYGAWQMLNARSFGWGLAASILTIIPTLDAVFYCLPWVAELGFGIWACVIINNADVRWLIRQNQKGREERELDHD